MTINARDISTAALLKVGFGIEGAGFVVDAMGTVANAFTSSARAAVAAYSSYEDMRLSLTALQARALVASGEYSTLEAAQGKAQERAEALQAEFERLAILSPFSNEGITQAFRLGSAMNFSTEQAQRLTAALVDTAAGTAGGSELMLGATIALGQAWQKGKFQAEEALQLVERGIPAWQYLADNIQLAGGQSSYTVAEIQDLTTRGLIPADKAIEAIVTGLERDFAGAAERSSGTVSGLSSSMGDLQTILLRTVSTPSIELLQPKFQAFIDSLQTAENQARAAQIGQNLADGLQFGIDAIEDFNRGIQVLTAWGDVSFIGASFEGITAPWKALLDEEARNLLIETHPVVQVIPQLESTVIQDYALEWTGLGAAIQAVEDDINNPDIFDATIAAAQEAAAAIQDTAAAVEDASFLRDDLGLSPQQEKFREDARQSLTAFLQGTAEEHAAHQANLAAIEQDAQGRRTDAWNNYRETYQDITTRTNEDIAAAAEQHADNVAGINARLADTLTSIAQQAADGAREAFSGSVQADVSFVQDSRDRLEDFNEKRKTIQQQGAWACYVDAETEALIESEEQAARAYVEREAEQSAHLGRMLADRATALALQNGIEADALNQMTAGIRAAFGVQATVSDLMFDRALAGLDQWAAAGGRNTNQVIAGFSDARDEAVRLTLAQEDLTEARVKDIVTAYSQGRISETEYLKQLQAVPGQVSAQLGLTVSGPIDSEPVATAVKQHHQDMTSEEQRYADRLEDIQIAAYEDRKQALIDYQTTIEEIDGEWYTAQQEVEAKRHEEKLQSLNAQYQKELQAHIAHLGELEAADRAWLESSLLIEARRAASIDANAAAGISVAERQYRQGVLSYEAFVAELQRIAANAAQVQVVQQQPQPDIVYYPDDPATQLPRRAAGGPVSASQPYIVGEEGWEVFVPRTAGTVYPQSSLQPPQRSVVVNIHNPQVRNDGDLRALRSQVRRVVEDVLNLQVDELILAG